MSLTLPELRVRGYRITQAEWLAYPEASRHRLTDGRRAVLRLDPDTQGTVLVPVTVVTPREILGWKP